jgi:hypothetical protein
MVNEQMYRKYLKYKSKYNNLKKQRGLGMTKKEDLPKIFQIKVDEFSAHLDKLIIAGENRSEYLYEHHEEMKRILERLYDVTGTEGVLAEIKKQYPDHLKAYNRQKDMLRNMLMVSKLASYETELSRYL